MWQCKWRQTTGGTGKNSHDTFENCYTHEKDISTNKTDGKVVFIYTCICYDDTNIACEIFVIFIKANYNNYIHDILKAYHTYNQNESIQNTYANNAIQPRN